MGSKAGWGAVIATFVLVAGGAIAQETSTNKVASNTDWTVFVDKNPTECWSVSTPKETVNTREGRVVAVTRGDILLMVFYRPAEGAAGQVAFTGGYPFRQGSNVTVDVSGTEYALIVGEDQKDTAWREDEWAWPASPSDDAKLVAAMKRGAQAVVSGISSRGTQTRDTFSLLGFTASVEDAEKRCAQ